LLRSLLGSSDTTGRQRSTGDLWVAHTPPGDIKAHYELWQMALLHEKFIISLFNSNTGLRNIAIHYITARTVL